MHDQSHAYQELIQENSFLKRRIKELEQAESDRKQIEVALIESKRRLADIIEFLPDPSYAIDLSGTVIAWNHAMEEMTGVNAKVIVGKGNYEYAMLLRGIRQPIMIDQAMGVARADEKNYEFVKREGDVLIAEAEITLRGKSIALWGKAAPLRDSHGNTIGAIQSFHDITELKQAKVALQESEKQVRRKLDAILSPEGDIGTLELSDIIDTEKIQKLMDEFYKLTHIGIGIIDLKGRVLVGTGWQEICTNFHRVNPETCRLCMESDLELTSNVPVGTFKKYRCKNNMWDMATPIMLGDRHVGNIFLGQFLFDDEVPDLNTFREQARRFGFNEREYIEALDRVPRWSRETVNTTMTFYAALAELIGNLSYSNIKLANTLEERKRAEEALEEQRRQLENANKELESFSYSISHDLRAPLRAIDGFTRMILKKQGTNFDKDTQNKFQVIRQNTQMMYRLIDGLLELSRLDRRALTMSTIDMDNTIKEVWEEIKIINPGRKMSLTVKPMQPGFGDRPLIRQVYSNLLSNAVKFTKNRDVALIETGGYINDEKENVYFVKDNGAGFDMAYYKKLFGVFQRLHNVEEFEGTGIGLATIQRIINKHGGRVWAEGKVDEGAIFYFSLPASHKPA